MLECKEVLRGPHVPGFGNAKVICRAPATIVEGSEYTLAAAGFGPRGSEQVMQMVRVQCARGHWYDEEINSVQMEG